MQQRGVLLFLLAFFPVLFMGFLGGAFYIRWHAASQQTRIPTSAVIQQVQTLSELVTVKYVIEKVVILEDAKWYGENRVLLLANGVVKAGIDLKELTPDSIRIQGDTLRITLPMERITDAYLDDDKSQVIEHTTGLVRQFNKDLEQNARRAAIADIRSAARHNGILRDARERAELQLKALFLQMGYKTVIFESPHK